MSKNTSFSCSMKSEEIQLLLKNLENRDFSDKIVLTSLQQIRTKAMATKGGIQHLVRLNCVPYLISMLRKFINMDTDAKHQQDSIREKMVVAVSIVANLLMDYKARLQVKRDGIETLVALLSESNIEDVQVRCCRALGNLAMEPSTCMTIAQVGTLPQLVKLLQVEYTEPKVQKSAMKSDSYQHWSVLNLSTHLEAKIQFPSLVIVQIVCRTVRYLIQDTKVRQQLIEEGITGALAVLLKADNAKLVSCTMHTMSELWIKMNKRITERMAEEVVRANVMQQIMNCIMSDDIDLSHQSFTVLLPLTGYPHAAALIGASSGVPFFLALLNSCKQHISHKDVISGLCQMAKEAVNRIKIRENGGLRVFVETLKDKTMAGVHDRIISSLLSYLYDDASLDVMLEEGLVNVLLYHLQFCGGYTSHPPIDLSRDAKELLEFGVEENVHRGKLLCNDDVSDSERHLLEETSSGLKIVNSKSVTKQSLEKIKNYACTEEKNLFHDEKSEFQEQTKVLGHVWQKKSEQGVKFLVKSPVNQNGSPTHAVTHNATSDVYVDSFSDSCTRDHMYSIKSPTYAPETNWSIDDFSRGVTCKSFEINEFDVSYQSSPGSSVSGDCSSNPSSPYSPLSIESYYSSLPFSLFSPVQSPANSNLSPTNSVVNSPLQVETDTQFSRCGSPLYTDASLPEEANIDCMLHFTENQLISTTQRISPVIDRTNSNSVLVFSSQEDSSSEEAESGNDCSVRSYIVNLGVLHSSENQDKDNELHDKVKALIPETYLDTFQETKSEKYQHKISADLKSQSKDNPTEKEINPESKVKRSLLHSLKGQSDMNNKNSFDNIGTQFFKAPEKINNDYCKSKQIKQTSLTEQFAYSRQANILILLSRISVREDPSRYLATSTVISCLTDHLALAQYPQDRCLRILSRILSSPHCLEYLLSMCAPSILVYSLLVCPVTGFKPRVIFQTKVPQTESQQRQDNIVEIHSIVTGSQSGNKSTNNSKTVCVEPVYENGFSCREDVKENHKDPVSAGVQLLEDLSCQAMSQYGEGVISHTFHCHTASRQLMFAISLLFLVPYWGHEKRLKFLFQMGILEKVLSALRLHHSANKATKEVATMGLIFLMHHFHLPSRIQPKDTKSLLHRAVDRLLLESNSYDYVNPNSAVKNLLGNCDTKASNLLVTTATSSSSDGYFCNTADTVHLPPDKCLKDKKLLAKVQDNTAVCAYSTAKKDLHLCIKKTNTCLGANRATLAKNSNLFSAMLQGSYLESTQSEICISNTTPEALLYVLHFLHGCNLKCSVLLSLEDVCTSQTDQTESSGNARNTKVELNSDTEIKDSLLQVNLNAITLADRFLLTNLVQYLASVVTCYHLNSTSAFDIFCFALFHSLSDLAEDSLQVLMLSHQPIAKTSSHLIDLAESEVGLQMTGILARIIKLSIANTEYQAVYSKY